MAPRWPPAAPSGGVVPAFVVLFMRVAGMIFGRYGWIALRNACPGCTSAWNPVKGLGLREDWDCVEVEGQQRDEEEGRRGVD